MQFYILICTVDNEYSRIESAFGSPAVFFDKQKAIEHCAKNDNRRVKYRLVQLKGREIPFELPKKDA